MPVQDDQRELELCRIFNLQWSSSHERGGTDATFKVRIGERTLVVPVEVKSTTGDSVSTARDVGLDHIRKWRSHFWIIGYYSRSNRPELQKTLCLTPNDLEPWVASVEQKILPDFRLAASAAERIQLADLYQICGDKPRYSLEDARNLHKQQWSTKQYKDAADIQVEGSLYFSQEKMLELLKLRSKYIAERGATLNNPHVPKTFLNPFFGTDREINEDWSVKFREVARRYFDENVHHPFSTWLDT